MASSVVGCFSAYMTQFWILTAGHAGTPVVGCITRTVSPCVVCSAFSLGTLGASDRKGLRAPNSHRAGPGRSRDSPSGALFCFLNLVGFSDLEARVCVGQRALLVGKVVTVRAEPSPGLRGTPRCACLETRGNVYKEDEGTGGISHPVTEEHARRLPLLGHFAHSAACGLNLARRALVIRA